MSDRTSAGLFADVFEYLAEEPDERNKKFARRLWGMIGEYDFTPCQMECDDALFSLGLAKKGVYPHHDQIYYLGDRGFDQADGVVNGGVQ